MNSPKLYGYEMTLVLSNGETREYHRVASSEKAAERMGLMQPRVDRVINFRPLTREQYEMTYGRRYLR